MYRDDKYYTYYKYILGSLPLCPVKQGREEEKEGGQR